MFTTSPKCIINLLLCVILLVTSVAPVHFAEHELEALRHDFLKTDSLDDESVDKESISKRVIPGYVLPDYINQALDRSVHEHSHHNIGLELCEICFLASALSSVLPSISSDVVLSNLGGLEFVKPDTSQMALKLYKHHARAPPSIS